MRKKEEILLSPMTKGPTPAEMLNGQSDNANNVTNKLDYTAIAHRLMKVSWRIVVILDLKVNRFNARCFVPVRAR